MTRTLPGGVVTFAFTDIEGSTALLRKDPGTYRKVLADHNRLLSAAWADHDGVLVNVEGDGQFVAFGEATSAVAACLAAQRALVGHPWPAGAPVLVRMGLHTGIAHPEDGDYVSLAVNQAARVSAAAHGGQVLLSGDCVRAAGDALPGGVALRLLGRFELKDFPSPEDLTQLVHPELPAAFPAPRAALAAGQDLPRMRTAFIGRLDSLPLVTDSVRAGGVTTLTGPGGTGKTRLASEVAHLLREDYRDGARFVELAGVTPDEVVETVAGFFGVHDAGAPGLRAEVVRGLARRELLLVLDNCEHVLDAVADLVEALLDGCPELTVLVTSREAMHLVGERVVPLPALDLPERGTDWRDLEHYDAVRLFLDRARSVRPDFGLDAVTGPAVSALCRRLDGLPLALELAAAALRSLPLSALLSAVEESQDVLSGALRRSQARQRGLGELISWSYDLLDERARRVHRRLALLAGGFTEEMAGAVTAEPDVRSVLRDLVDKSLLVLGEDEPPRYRMLETIREFAGRQLEAAGERGEVLARQRRFLTAALAECAGRHRNRGEYQRLVEREGDNVRVALDLPAEGGPDDDWGDLVAAVFPYWDLRGRSPDVDRVLDHVPAATGLRSGLHADLLAMRVFALIGWGVGANGEPLAEEDIVESVGRAVALSALPDITPDERAHVLRVCAGALNYLGRNDQARRLVQQAAALDPGTLGPENRDRYAGLIAGAFAICDFFDGDYARAVENNRLGVVAFSAAGDRYAEATTEFNLGEALDCLHGPGAGTAHLLVARRLAQELGNPQLLCLAEQQLMDNAAALGDVAAGRGHALTLREMAELSRLPGFARRAQTVLDPSDASAVE